MTKGDPSGACAAIRAGAQDFIGKDELTPERLARRLRFALDRLQAQESMMRSLHHVAVDAIRRLADVQQQLEATEREASERLAANMIPQLDCLARDLETVANDLNRHRSTRDDDIRTAQVHNLARRTATQRDRQRAFVGQLPMQPRQTHLIPIVDQAARLAGTPCHRPAHRTGVWAPTISGDPNWLVRAFFDLFTWARALGRCDEPHAYPAVPLVSGQSAAPSWLLPPPTEDAVVLRLTWVGAPPLAGLPRFEPFHRSVQPGPDLSMALGVLRKHQAGLLVADTPDGGSLEVWLPTRTRATVNRSPTTHLRSLMALVCTPDAAFGRFVAHALGPRGYDVRVFQSGASAWSRIARGLRPDIVVVELGSQPCTSDVLVRSMAAAHHTAPTVFIRRTDHAADRTLPWRTSTRVLVPPITEERLAALCAEALSGESMENDGQNTLHDHIL